MRGRRAYPQADRGDRERRRVVIAPHAHPRFVACHIVDPVRDGLADRVPGKVVHAHRLRRPGRLPFLARILEIADQFLLLRIDRDDRLLAPQQRRRRRVDVLELRVATRMRGPLAPFADRLETVAQLVEQTPHGGRTHAPAGRR